MESYHGLIVTARDALILLEASELELIPVSTRRLTDFERARLVKNGAVFVWNENDSKMKRWTDGRTWSASRVNGAFLTYREMDSSAKKTLTIKGSGLIKQSFSVINKFGDKYHVISYVDSEFSINENLARPSMDPRFANVVINRDNYPAQLFDNSENRFVECTHKRKAVEDNGPSRKQVAIAPRSTTSGVIAIAPAPAPAPASMPATVPTPKPTTFLPLGITSRQSSSPSSPLLSSRRSSFSDSPSTPSTRSSSVISLVLPPLKLLTSDTKPAAPYCHLSEDARLLTTLDKSFM